jgi:hypothetical protein
VSPRERAAAAYAAAELAEHPADKAALKAAAATWERIAGPGTAWSTKILRKDLADLKRHVAQANGPFKAPQPPKAPPPAAVTPGPTGYAFRPTPKAVPEEVIQF